MNIYAIEQTIEKLKLSDIDESATIEALQRMVNKNKCKHAEYTSEPFRGCKTCGGVIVICSNENVKINKRNSGGCQKGKCEFFEAVEGS